MTIFISSVQKEFATERKALAASLGGDYAFEPKEGGHSCPPSAPSGVLRSPITEQHDRNVAPPWIS